MARTDAHTWVSSEILSNVSSQYLKVCILPLQAVISNYHLYFNFLKSDFGIYAMMGLKLCWPSQWLCFMI